MGYDIIEKFITKNISDTSLAARGLVIHETANPNDNTARKEQQYFNSGDRDASAHAFIDDKEIIQCVPWDMVAWHAGRTANRQFWGVEMCHTSNSAKFEEIWKRAVWLTAFLYSTVAYPKITRVNASNTMSHAEVSALWRETDHVDPDAYFAQHGKNIVMFRSDVQKQVDSIFAARIMSLRKVVSTPEYWKENAVSGKFVNGAFMKQLILNFVAMFEIVDTFGKAVSYLWQNGIIVDHEYWNTRCVENGQVDGLWAYKVLVGMGSKL